MYNTNAYNLFFFKTHSDLTDPTDFYCPAERKEIKEIELDFMLMSVLNRTTLFENKG